ncbi:hypothetical protein [Brevibacillus choshinensis]|uniref:Uncharacterized protein n=1 Tax=Brevibacillus choshinensis TaxID=54911 RepID=A0ABX7FH36_BRECH|nr:hypothetical protein [Brevibacillus choshinensis]QRG65523.1 hypothetical protein JNE38_18060 [Brevibacillus choshinensis]
MKSLLKLMMAFVMAFGISFVGYSAADASEASDVSEASEASTTAGQLKPEFVDFPSTLEVGKKYKITVNTDSVGSLESEGKFFFLISNGEKIESVKTTLSRTKKYYTTTGYFTPKSEGQYILLYAIKQKNAAGEVVEGNLEKSFRTVDKNKINLTVSPNVINAQLGEEIPVLVTYNSNITTKLEFNQKVTELGSSRKNGVYKKVYLWKPEKKGEYTLKVKATQSRTDRVETKEITIVVE